jgi:hypothetical protein
MLVRVVHQLVVVDVEHVDVRLLRQPLLGAPEMG